MKIPMTTSTSMRNFKIIENDSYLKAYKPYFDSRFECFEAKLNDLMGKNSCLSDFANAHHFYGCHLVNGKWVFREWAPNATDIYLIGQHSDWKCSPDFRFENMGTYWELVLDGDVLHKGSLYRLLMKWDGGEGERLPAYSTYVVQDQVTKIFSAVIWSEVSDYKWKNPYPKNRVTRPLIYETHVGMSSEAPMVNTYNDFRVNVLPRIVKAGYNTLQIMAIQEHPYYGSFGYHVSNFFAPSSRFGTPEELKQLIDEAHSYGLYVILDLIHSHAVKNEVEGLSCYDGTDYQYFHSGAKGTHFQWDSRCFNYDNVNVVHFLLSNCKYWLEEFHFDGFRFDGVTSMLYWSHGMNKNFMCYDDYFNDDVDIDACVYLMLANKLIHEINENAITIAEEMSGMPGISLPIEDGGFGFDFKLAMGIPDYWIKLVKEVPDEFWNVNNMYYELTNRRAGENSISYVESHDQAIVGDKTLAFRLMDSKMYTSMAVESNDIIVERGMALHKMIRLITIATAGEGYLNFMGNEFGHPEWIDFPRADNGWSYHYCRRQWSLVDNRTLKYFYLNQFDMAMIQMTKSFNLFNQQFPYKVFDNEVDKVVAFVREKLLFVFNFHPCNSYNDYFLSVPAGEYEIILDTDDLEYGGLGRNDKSIHHFTFVDGDDNKVQMYLPARTAMVLKIV